MVIQNNIARAMTAACALFALGLAVPQGAHASSHMDAPMITLDPAANTTDVYAFRTNDSSGRPYLTVALSVYPFEEPGIGPNIYNFDPTVMYELHVSTGSDVAAGIPTYTYQFQFTTSYKNVNTIAQSFLGVIENVDDANQNLTQRYNVTRLVGTSKTGTTLFSGNLVPPNNQGLLTKYYNQGDNGENLAKEGVATTLALDKYTSQTLYTNTAGYQAFAGQRDDGFYADIQSIFDLDFTFSGPNKPFDSQGGFNVHTIVLNIPISELGTAGTSQQIGVYATTNRQKVTVLRGKKSSAGSNGNFVQVGRQGNPLFNEALVAIKDKNTYNTTGPNQDSTLFRNYALNPELAVILGSPYQTNRTDLVGIFIPDLIKVDLSTGPARLAGGARAGAPPAAPDDAGFNRLSIFGGDTLHSTIQSGFGGGTVPGGWPNGRRFGDDVLDIAVLAIYSDLRNPAALVVAPAPADPGVDKVDHNDIGYNKVFPYAATPLNGRHHTHHDDTP